MSCLLESGTMTRDTIYPNGKMKMKFSGRGIDFDGRGAWTLGETMGRNIIILFLIIAMQNIERIKVIRFQDF